MNQRSVTIVDHLRISEKTAAILKLKFHELLVNLSPVSLLFSVEVVGGKTTLSQRKVFSGEHVQTFHVGAVCTNDNTYRSETFTYYSPICEKDVVLIGSSRKEVISFEHKNDVVFPVISVYYGKY